MFQAILDNLGRIGTGVGGLVACCGGAFYFDTVPATRSWVIAETRGIYDSRLETNDVKRQLLRKEKFDRTMELERETQPNVRAILRERLDWIDGQLEEANRARDQLTRERSSR